MNERLKTWLAETEEDIKNSQSCKETILLSELHEGLSELRGTTSNQKVLVGGLVKALQVAVACGEKDKAKKILLQIQKLSYFLSPENIDLIAQQAKLITIEKVPEKPNETVSVRQKSQGLINRFKVYIERNTLSKADEIADAITAQLDDMPEELVDRFLSLLPQLEDKKKVVENKPEGQSGFTMAAYIEAYRFVHHPETLTEEVLENIQYAISKAKKTNDFNEGLVESVFLIIMENLWVLDPHRKALEAIL